RLESPAPERIEVRREVGFADREPVGRVRDRMVGEDGDVRPAGAGGGEEQGRRDERAPRHRTSGMPRARSRRISGIESSAMTMSGRKAAMGGGSPRSARARPSREVT